MPITKTRFPGEPAKLDDALKFSVGRWDFAICWRAASNTQGEAIHVFGPANGVREEVLRFDCFDRTPHYHLGWSYRDEHFIVINDDNPFEWTLNKIRQDLDQLLADAHAEALTQQELDAIPALVDQLQKAADDLRPKS